MKKIILKFLYKEVERVSENAIPLHHTGTGVSFAYKKRRLRYFITLIKAKKNIFYKIYSKIILSLLDVNFSNLPRNGFYSIGAKGSAGDIWIHLLSNKYGIKKNPLVLIPGCGDGQELIMLTPLKPKKVIGVDLYDNTEVWDKLDVLPMTEKKFILSDIVQWDDKSYFKQIDLIESNNALEHFSDPESFLLAMQKYLAPDGVIYASFGPLYPAFGGDHFLFLRAGFYHAYDHLLLEEDQYQKYISKLTIENIDKIDGNYCYGREYINSKLFSYWDYKKYLELFEKYFEIVLLQVAIDENAIRYKLHCPENWNKMINKGYSEDQLLCSSIHVILKNKL